MFEQNPLSKLLKDLFIGIEQLLEVFCLDSIGKMFVFAQKKREIRIPHLLNFEQCLFNSLAIIKSVTGIENRRIS